MQIVRSFLILIFLFISFISFSQEPIPFTENGKWGLKSNDGSIIIPPTFQKVGWSDGGNQFVNEVIGYQKNGFWGILSNKGKALTSPLYKSLEHKGGDFFIASTLGRFSKIPLYGILDKKGKVVSSFRYNIINYGYEGQYIVTELQENRLKTGIIVPDGKVLINLKYQGISVIGQNQYLLRTFNDYYGICDLEGNQIINNIYDELSVTENNELLLVKDGLIGLSDRMGNFIHEMENKLITTNRLDKFPVWSLRNQSNKEEERILADSIRSIGINKFLVYRNDKRVIYNRNLALSGSFEGVSIIEILEDAVIVESEAGVEVLKLDGSRLLNKPYDSIYFDKDYFYAKSDDPTRKGWLLYSRIGSRLSANVSDKILPQSGKRIRFKNNGFWGIMDFDGSIMVQPKYDSILPFENKRAIVSKLGLWGVIDDQNQWVILPYEENLQRLSNKLFVSKKGFHIKFFNTDGIAVRSITTDYQLLGENIIIRGESGKLGIMDYNGSLLTSIAYDEIQQVAGSKFFMVRIDTVSGVIDQYNTTVVPFTERLEHVIGYSENLLAVQLDGKFGFVDKAGQLRIANRYDSIQLFSEGLAPYKLNGRWGFLNDREQLVIQPVFDEVLPFYKGVAAVREKDRWALISKTGEMLEPFKYKSIVRLESGKYLMQGENGIGLNDENGQQIMLPAYEYLEDIGAQKAIIRKNSKWGVINYNGTYVIPTLYDKVIFDKLQDKYLIMED